jgi:hypothetical protein
LNESIKYGYDVALAGRRIDLPHVIEMRFPFQNVSRVRQRLRGFFSFYKITTLVCSAACGADLLALNIANELNIDRKIILPFAPVVFKMKSVNHCTGDWKTFFENAIETDEGLDLLIMDSADDDQQAYEKANVAILDTAEKLEQQKNEKMIVLIVWDGKRRGTDDVTAHFLNEAKSRKLAIKEINTL